MVYIARHTGLCPCFFTDDRTDGATPTEGHEAWKLE